MNIYPDHITLCKEYKTIVDEYVLYLYAITAVMRARIEKNTDRKYDNESF